MIRLKAVIYSFSESLQPLTAITAITYLHLGVDGGDIAFLKSVFFITLFLSEIPSGYLADRLGFKWLAFIGKVFEALEIALIIFGHQFLNVLVLSEILLGIGFACVSGLRSLIARDLSDSTARAKLVGALESASLAGLCFSLIVAPWLLNQSVMLTGTIQIICGILSCVALVSTKSKSISIRESRSPVLSWKLIDDPKAMTIFSFLVAIMVVFRVIPELLPIHLNRSMSLFQTSTVLTAMVAIASFVAWYFGRVKLPDFFKGARGKWLLLLCPITIFALVPVSDIPQLLFGSVLISIFRGIALPVLTLAGIEATEKSSITGVFFSSANVISYLMSGILILLISSVGEVKNTQFWSTSAIVLSIIPVLIVKLKFLKEHNSSY